MSEVIPLDPIAPRVLAAIARLGGAPWTRGPAQVTPDADLCSDLKFDSLDFVTLAVELEEAFRIEIPDVEASRWRRVADVIATVRRATAGRVPA